jgi:hypothetical protein
MIFSNHQGLISSMYQDIISIIQSTRHINHTVNILYQYQDHINDHFQGEMTIFDMR